MKDPILEIMMHGDLENKKTSYEINIDNELEAYIRNLDQVDTNSFNPLVGKREKLAKIKNELLDKYKFTNLENYLVTAFEILKNDGMSYLNAADYDLMQNTFVSALAKMEVLDLSKLNKEYREILGISTPVIESILTVAFQKFNEEEYANSLSLFVLMTLLDQSDSKLWYQMGIAAQNIEDFELALKAYGMCICLESEPLQLIGSRLFSAQCYLELGLKDEADLEYQEAKQIGEQVELDEMWRTLLSQLGVQLDLE